MISPFTHTQLKARSLNLVLVPTLGMHHFLCVQGTVFCIKQNAVFIGSLFQINQYLNRLMNERIAS